jgi:hypothetical protein
MSLVLAVCLALTGCSSGSNNPGSTNASGIPSYATGTDQHGQEGFATYWVQVFNKATVSGDTSKLKALAAKSCTVCLDFAHRVETVYKAGGQIRSKGFTIKGMVPIAGGSANQPGLQLSLNSAPQMVTPSKGAKTKTYAGGDLSWRFLMVRAGDHWLVRQIEV